MTVIQVELYIFFIWLLKQLKHFYLNKSALGASQGEMENHGIAIQKNYKILILSHFSYSNTRNYCELQLWKWICSDQKQAWFVEDEGKDGVRKAGSFKGVDFFSEKYQEAGREKKAHMSTIEIQQLQFKQSLWS